MAILMTDDSKNKLDTIFANLMNNPSDKNMINELSVFLSKVFSKNISVEYIDCKKCDFFVMSVVPADNAIDKIIMGLSKGEQVSVIKTIWSNCNDWTVEIDSRLFNKSYIDITPRELSALLLHEIGHVINSDSVINKINNTIRFEIAKGPASTRAFTTNPAFSKLLSIPIINACVFNKERDELKNEIRADNFASKMGYTYDLLSALNKVTNIKKYDKNSISGPLDMTSKMYTDMIKRRGNLSRRTFLRVRDRIPNGTRLRYRLESVGNGFYKLDNEKEFNDRFRNYLYETADKVMDDYYTEFFGIKKKVKPITRDQLDYIYTQTEDIETNNDKMMILSYINSKIDLCDYYISILSDPKQAKKYKIPYTVQALENIKKELYAAKTKVYNKKIIENKEAVLVYYPPGYEG